MSVPLLVTLSDIPRNIAVALYGAGEAGSNVLRLLIAFRPDLEPRCFVDSFKKGKKDGLPVVLAEEFFRNPGSEAPFLLITSLQWGEIEREVRRHRRNRYLVVPPRFLFPSAMPGLTGNREIEALANPLSRDLFTETDRRRYAEPLEQALRLLDHDEDQRLFRVLTSSKGEGAPGCRLRQLADFFYSSPLKRQYFDFIRYCAVQTVIEGGVADGYDTVEFIRRQKEGGGVYGFEPNIGDYRRGRYRETLDADPRVHIFPQGLWSQKKRLYFKSAGLGSRLTESVPPDPGAWETVDAVSIDDTVREHRIEKVDLIKMDIEGAEIEALKGAQQTLRRHRPQLAICIYHRKEHFWEVPLLLDDLLDNYVYRLGHYTAGTLETVWYGIPGELCNCSGTEE